MRPCKHLDYDQSKYGPDITLETCAPHFPEVRFWLRGETWTKNEDGSRNPDKVQFCKLRGRIKGIFQCYGEMHCYVPDSLVGASEQPAVEPER